MRYTFLTPTYNRCHTLEGVYQSLSVQTLQDFEWMIIDDGSTDRTRELVESWEASFPIRYQWKQNGGKHTALNLGISLAQGEFVIVFDSDDRCTANALERFDYHWRQIPDASRFANLSSLCCDPNGTIVGEPFPAQYVDAFTLADQLRYAKWERWRMDRTDVLRQFPFPEGEPFVSESLIWSRISRHYASRFFNEALRIYQPQPDSLSHRIFALRVASPKATMAHCREMAFSPAPSAMRLRAAVNFIRFGAIAALPQSLTRWWLRKV